MKVVTLYRVRTSPQGTWGILVYGNVKFYTLELPWHDNKPNISCIPDGEYVVDWTYSPHFKRNVFLINTKKRTGVRIHSANFAGDNPPYHKQLNGCLALGEKIGMMDGQLAIFVSKSAVRRFEKLMNKESFKLEIKWV